MITFYVCGNTETIVDGYTNGLDFDELAKDDVAIAWSNAASAHIRDALMSAYMMARVECVVNVDSNFSNWHGGMHTRRNAIGYRVGLVRCDVNECGHMLWAKDLVDDAALAGDAARDAAIALEVESLSRLDT